MKLWKNMLMTMDGKRGTFYLIFTIGFLNGIVAFWVISKLIELICWVSGISGIKI